MQIVIDIGDKVYGLLKYFEQSLGLNDKKDDNDDVKTALIRAVINGTPLPKGHGRLIDADKLEPRDISPEAWYSPMWGLEMQDIEDAPTIIEADKSERSDKE